MLWMYKLINNSLAVDMVDVIRRMKLLGFNAIRLPFSMQDLFFATPRDFKWQYCTNVDSNTFLTSVTNPTVPPPAGVSSVPKNPLDFCMRT